MNNGFGKIFLHSKQRDYKMTGDQITKAFEANDFHPLIVQCNKEIHEEVGLESGCKAYVTTFCDDGSGCYCLTLDFTEFEEDNKRFMPKTWYGSNDELVHWYDSELWSNI